MRRMWRHRDTLLCRAVRDHLFDRSNPKGQAMEKYCHIVVAATPERRTFFDDRLVRVESLQIAHS